MATKSFLKNVCISNKASANSFVNALQHAEGKTSKKVDINKSVETVKDYERIRNMFK